MAENESEMPLVKTRGKLVELGEFVPCELIVVVNWAVRGLTLLRGVRRCEGIDCPKGGSRKVFGPQSDSARDHQVPPLLHMMDAPGGGEAPLQHVALN